MFHPFPVTERQRPIYYWPTYTTYPYPHFYGGSYPGHYSGVFLISPAQSSAPFVPFTAPYADPSPHLAGWG
ncbi:hypothetical protein [Pseudalkalibacillus caeni]|uniref:Uncharacterized protein n=1 Tax=Exobacillus caeni TaxID=2574798 RepID=A0A5R9F312_9BACL|nr:hypothetical protein [Pseudalkalibacillus caeni]TLS35948.1 hypothetical protein FCL54_17290 [Pseudalkalibacillus caeni]